MYSLEKWQKMISLGISKGKLPRQNWEGAFLRDYFSPPPGSDIVKKVNVTLFPYLFLGSVCDSLSKRHGVFPESPVIFTTSYTIHLLLDLNT